jgi:hypothetical protein
MYWTAGAGVMPVGLPPVLDTINGCNDAGGPPDLTTWVDDAVRAVRGTASVIWRGWTPTGGHG